jgi:hypothetical protein
MFQSQYDISVLIDTHSTKMLKINGILNGGTMHIFHLMLVIVEE